MLAGAGSCTPARPHDQPNAHGDHAATDEEPKDATPRLARGRRPGSRSRSRSNNATSGLGFGGVFRRLFRAFVRVRHGEIVGMFPAVVERGMEALPTLSRQLVSRSGHGLGFFIGSTIVMRRSIRQRSCSL
jgi:hypothetical protein